MRGDKPLGGDNLSKLWRSENFVGVQFSWVKKIGVYGGKGDLYGNTLPQNHLFIRLQKP